MSRTTRRRLPGYGPGERLYRAAEARHAEGRHPGNSWSHLNDYDFRKAHWFHGRDAYGAKLAIGEPFAGAPKGYTWAEVWGLRGKRYAKKSVARIRRSRGKTEISDFLADDFID